MPLSKQQHLSSKDFENKEDIIKLESKAELLREAYIKILSRWCNDKTTKPGDFDNINYELKRSFNDGYVYALNEVMKIIGD